MAAITLQRLRQSLAEAYAAGYHGCLDLCPSYVDEAITRLMLTPAAPVLSVNDGWRVWTVASLKKQDVGTIFEHATRGRGWLDGRGMTRFVTWADGTVSHFLKDEPPWTEPMRVVGKVLKEPPPKKKYRRSMVGTAPQFDPIAFGDAPQYLPQG